MHFPRTTRFTYVREAAALIFSDLDEAQRRIDAGEPFNTTAAEMGYTPRELRELLDEAQYAGSFKSWGK